MLPNVARHCLLSTLAGVAIVALAAAAPSPAEASRQSSRQCRPAVEGSASGLGVLGRGERRAGLKARTDWERKVTALYGERFASFSTARGVTTRCQGGTIAPARCTVRARPCRS